MTTNRLEYDPELEREAHEDRVAEERERAIEEYLDGLAGMSARDWSTMLGNDHCPSEWVDDDEFWEIVGARAKLAFENGRGI